MHAKTRLSPQARLHIWAGFCTSLIGVGLSRFAYSALIPAIIDQQWFSPGSVAYLGAANLAGYLIGASGARPAAARLGSCNALRLAMLVAAISFFTCAQPASFTWFFIWRVLSGISGGFLIVLAAPTILPSVAVENRGFAMGLIFSGVGTGIIISGTLVPVLISHDLSWAWIGLGAICVVLMASAWFLLPSDPARTTAQSTANASGGAKSGNIPKKKWPEITVWLVGLVYSLVAISLVPHMVFLVDYSARILALGNGFGGLCWTVFGAGALCGPVTLGKFGDRFGFRITLIGMLMVDMVMTVVPALGDDKLLLLVSAFVVGATVPGVVSLILGWIHELIDDATARQQAWSFATTLFAIGQAIFAYVFAWMFSLGAKQAHHIYILAGIAAAAAMILTFIFPTLQSRLTRAGNRPAASSSAAE
ncbi:YbfB/YjiJ family MFS transporter [Thalassospira marina]|uniref:MFS transporter n=1 Tax=Thalassospira marina TaxID=2048283 RepID=A0A2N3KSA1_9PROT|nr:YbfB/YjiJ family MFS transporter [Thalassospira marina]PKR53425.1 MFS transporter [Thalassospira marina]